MNDIGVSLNGVLIMIFAEIALRYARARKIAVHRRWALRTFMVVSGVRFLRVIYKFATATLVLLAAAATSIGVYGRIKGWLS